MIKTSKGQLVCQHLDKTTKAGRLIGQIVYKLYGLTFGEVEIIEESVSLSSPKKSA